MKTVNNYLYKHYYFNNDGTPDEIADSLGDCIIQCAYVILKNKYCLKKDFYKSFLNETTIRLGVSDNNKIETFDTIENIFDKIIFLDISDKVFSLILLSSILLAIEFASKK